MSFLCQIKKIRALYILTLIGGFYFDSLFLFDLLESRAGKKFVGVLEDLKIPKDILKLIEL